jgi:hypothetical protein
MKRVGNGAPDFELAADASSRLCPPYRCVSPLRMRSTLVGCAPNALRGHHHGTEAVSRAAPDGSTLLTTSTAFLIAPHLRKLNYDPLTSFEPICQLVSAPIIVVVNSASPYRTLADWLNAAREKPGSLTLASIPASLSLIAFEMLKRAANVDIFVPKAT